MLAVDISENIVLSSSVKIKTGTYLSFALEKLSTMALNPQYDAIGKAFVQQYYMLFDDAAQRHQLSALYNVSTQLIINRHCDRST